ncbi:Transcription initiation factor TFIID subunit 6 [Histomonas meleagridis]|uniref:Transcription initiation factor TFIID subunit 6 n=1 Tax=Histomonas meleagridis TaxID=135588 RepID=UPI00355A5552|nr:Transcription initiation factor TFIID subunit 6 [Histomonas meleagridis]KAH0804569.1 Transcription initiation factor TFIID subunit 6 [Histomonas meleagridis]
MSAVSQETIQAIADKLGITLKHSLLELLAQETEFRVERIISPASILFKKTHSSKLTVRQVNMILESQRIPTLFGYSSSSNYEMKVVNSEDTLLYTIDNTIDLNEVVSDKGHCYPRKVPFNFQWLLVDGTPIGKRSNKNTFGQILDSTPYNPSLDYLKYNKPEQKIKNEQIISNDLQSYYGQAIDFFEAGDQESQEILYDNIVSDGGIQSLIPGFLQFIIYKLTISLDDISVLKRVINFTSALVNNPSLPISFYAHTFLRICFTIILKNIVSGDDIEMDTKIRVDTAQILHQICNVCNSGYPQIRTLISNTLISAIFNPNSSLASQHGAILSLSLFDENAILRVYPHIPSYVLMLKRITAFEAPSQKDFIVLILNTIHKMVSDAIDSGKIDIALSPKMNGVKNEINVLLDKLK